MVRRLTLKNGSKLFSFVNKRVSSITHHVNRTGIIVFRTLQNTCFLNCLFDIVRDHLETKNKKNNINYSPCILPRMFDLARMTGFIHSQSLMVRTLGLFVQDKHNHVGTCKQTWRLRGGNFPRQAKLLLFLVLVLQQPLFRLQFGESYVHDSRKTKMKDLLTFQKYVNRLNVPSPDMYRSTRKKQK